MKFEIYFAIGGLQLQDLEFAKKGHIGGSIRRIGHRRANVWPSPLLPMTVWESERRIVEERAFESLEEVLSSHPVGDNVKQLLLDLERGGLPQLTSKTKVSQSCWLKILCRHGEREEPRSFAIDRETVALLHKFNASIEFEAVIDME